MKKRKSNKWPLLAIAIIAVTISCNKDEGCDTNATLNSDCFNLKVELNVQTVNTTPKYTRENLQLIFQFPPEGPQERVRLTVRSNDAPQDNTPADTILFQQGVTYSGISGGCIFNGDFSAGGIPCRYQYIFTKVDRDNNLISGEIDFSYSNDFGSDEFSSSFENVLVTGDEF